MTERGELNWPELIGKLSLFDDSPAFQWCEDGFGDKVCESSRWDKLDVVSFVCSFGEIVGIVEGFYDFVWFGHCLTHRL